MESKAARERAAKRILERLDFIRMMVTEPTIGFFRPSPVILRSAATKDLLF